MRRPSTTRTWRDSRRHEEVFRRPGRRHCRRGPPGRHRRLPWVAAAPTGTAAGQPHPHDLRITLAWAASSPRKPLCLVPTKSFHDYRPNLQNFSSCEFS